MNWAYVSGFFDGEGCVCYNRKRLDNGVQLDFCQSTKQEKVLLEIQSFLIGQGIKALFYRRVDCKSPRSNLKVVDYPSVYKCIKMMMPYLIVKLVKASQAFGDTKENIHRMKLHKTKINLAVRFWNTGMGYHKIENMTGVDQRTLKRRLKDLGLNPRPIGTNQYNIKQTPPPFGYKLVKQPPDEIIETIKPKEVRS